jgi:glyoxylase-like metal-dependent hydrolase (beta-lactamase superfamily II)
MRSYYVRPLIDQESSTLTYIIIDKKTRDAAIIDPVIENFKRDMGLIKELGVRLKYIFETHVHADHITSASKLKTKTGAKIVYSKNAGVKEADINLQNGDEINIGTTKVKALYTPGHTDTCLSYLFKGAVFTGDTLLIRGCGRTDFQAGNANTLYESVTKKLFTLPDDTLVYPGHDYKGMICSTIGEEKINNPRLKAANSRGDFVKIMNGLNLPYPKKMDIAVPANKKAGKDFKIS